MVSRDTSICEFHISHRLIYPLPPQRTARYLSRSLEDRPINAGGSQISCASFPVRLSFIVPSLRIPTSIEKQLVSSRSGFGHCESDRVRCRQIGCYSRDVVWMAMFRDAAKYTVPKMSFEPPASIRNGFVAIEYRSESSEV